MYTGSNPVGASSNYMKSKIKSIPKILIISALVELVVGFGVVYCALSTTYSLVGANVSPAAAESQLDSARIMVSLGSALVVIGFISAILSGLSLVVRYIRLKSKS